MAAPITTTTSAPTPETSTTTTTSAPTPGTPNNNLFDIEINITSKLTQDGLDNVNKYFYDNTQDSTISQAIWDKTFLPNASDIDQTILKNYQFSNYKNISPADFISTQSSNSDFQISKLYIKNNSIVPLVGSGNAKFHRTPYTFSNDAFTLPAKYDEVFDRFYLDLSTSDPNLIDIRIFTNGIVDGIADIKKEFNFVDVSSFTITQIAQAYLPKITSRNNFYVVVDSNDNPIAVYGATHNSKNTWLFDIKEYGTFNRDNVPNSGDVFYDTDLNKIFINKGNYFVDFIHEIAFKRNTNSYQYTYEKSSTGSYVAYIKLNSNKSQINNLKLGTIPQGGTAGIFSLPEYPATGISFSPNTLTYTEYNTSVAVDNPSGDAVDIFINYTLTPLVTSSRRNFTGNDSRILKTDLAPNSCNYKNGTLCLFNTEADTTLVPAKLTIEVSSDSLSILGSVKATATLSNEDGLPVEGKEVSISIINDSLGTTSIAGSGTTSISGFTNMAGQFSTSIINERSGFGWYLDKAWAGDKSISAGSLVGSSNIGDRKSIFVPFEIGTTSPSSIYLYMVTADDPILGMQTTSDDAHVKKIKDYYTNNTLSSYNIAGRCIAYVDIEYFSETVIKSTFIKPILVSKLSDTTKKIPIKNLYVTNTNSSKPNTSNTIANNPTGFEIGANTATSSIAGWDNNWLITPDYFQYKEATNLQSCYKITFGSDIPGYDDPNVVGYFLIADTTGIVDINATYHDSSYNFDLTSDPIGIILSNFITSDTPFTLTEGTFDNVNNILGTFGYYTVSDYMKSPFGLSSCSVVCQYSDGEKKCIRPTTVDPQGHLLINYNGDYFKFNNEKIIDYCKNTSSSPVDPITGLATNTVHDDNIALACPGYSGKLINQFILPTSNQIPNLR